MPPDITKLIIFLMARYIEKMGQPIFIKKKSNEVTVGWLVNNILHRYGGPVFITDSGNLSYWIHGKNVTETVEAWLSERDYIWETMSEQEKWELDLFMRSL